MAMTIKKCLAFPVNALQQAIRLKPDFVEAHNGLGNTYFVQRGYSAAIEQFKRAISLKPDYNLGYFNLGITYVKINDKKMAVEQYQVLQRLDPQLASRLLAEINK